MGRQLLTELETIMNETFTLSSRIYLNLSEFQKHQFGISHDLCVHFGRPELLCPYILPINIFHREELCVFVDTHPNYW